MPSTRPVVGHTIPLLPCLVTKGDLVY